MSDFTELTGLIGEPCATRLQTSHGGTRIAIPKRLTDTVQNLFGPAAADVIARFGGGRVAIPTGKPVGHPAAGQGADHATILRLRRNGASPAQIARAQGITEAAVRSHLIRKGTPDAAP